MDVRPILILALLLVAPGLAAAQNAERAERTRVLELRLGFELKGVSRLVRLSQVATVTADPEHAWPEIRNLVVAQRAAATVTRGKILRRLAAAGLPADRVCFVGPGVCKRSDTGATRVRVTRVAPTSATANPRIDDESWRRTLPARLRGPSDTPTRVRR